VDEDTMLIKEYKSENQLISGDLYGIPEPDGPEFTDYNLIDFVIVPGVAFDRNNNRMGRGKAYYDKFLKHLTAYKSGICFDFQLVNEVPSDENDISMDIVISD
jgi:5-formyltetrahydrofolate cyclo-ligase